MSGKWTLEKFGERDEARQRGELNCKVELCVRQKERRSFVLLGIRNGEERSRAVDSAAMTSAGDRLQLRSFQLGGGVGERSGEHYRIFYKIIRVMLTIY